MTTRYPTRAQSAEPMPRDARDSGDHHEYDDGSLAAASGAVLRAAPTSRRRRGHADDELGPVHQRITACASSGAAIDPARLAPPTARSLAEEGQADARMGVPLARGNRARGAQRAARVHADARDGGAPAHSPPRPATHVRVTAAAAGRVRRLVKEQLGHGSIQITVDTYGHLIPGANRAAVDRLDDDVSTCNPGATRTIRR